MLNLWENKRSAGMFEASPALLTSPLAHRRRDGMADSYSTSATKICRACRQELPIESFAVRVLADATRGTICKPCDATRQRNRCAEFSEEDHRRLADGASQRRRVKPPARTEALVQRVRRNVRAYQRRNPLKVAARMAVARALQSGGLVRRPCEVCGKTKSEAHHDDYAKPLDVRWLCNGHHREHHKIHGKGLNG